MPVFKFWKLKWKDFLFFIFCFFRKSVDVNRDKEEAAQGCPDAEAAWETYHNTIEAIIKTFEGQKGLLLDFHGQVKSFFQLHFT